MNDPELENLIGLMSLEGYTDTEISNELDIGLNTIKYTRRKLGILKEVVRYSDEELIELLKSYGDIGTRDLSKIRDAPSYDTYVRRFGSWSKAKKLAGFNACNSIKTDKELLQILRDSENKTYDYFQDSNNRKKVPSGTTYRQRFGSWSKALELAGLPANSFSLQQNKPTLVYLVEFENYYKVGITQQSVEHRFRGYPKYTIIMTLSCSTLQEAKNIEREWLSNVAHLAYYPMDLRDNNGATECFKF